MSISDSIIDQLTAIDQAESHFRNIHLVENAHEPIIDKRTFERVQKIKGKTRKSVSLQSMNNMETF